MKAISHADIFFFSDELVEVTAQPHNVNLKKGESVRQLRSNSVDPLKPNFLNTAT